MRPTEDILIRTQKYVETHNVEYLIDAINFCMIIYRNRTKLVLDIAEIEIFKFVFADALIENDFYIAVSDIINYFNDYNDIRYIVVLADLLEYEVKYSYYEDAYYKETHGTTEVAGLYVNFLN